MSAYKSFKTKHISISLGNAKLGNIPQFNLPPRKSCPNCKHCSGIWDGHKYSCYADKALRIYPTVSKCWNRNLKACRKNLDNVYTDIVEYLQTSKPEWFRIHSAGDFYSQEYLDMWIRITKEFPDVRFLAFTKSFHLSFRSKPRNLKVIYSIMPTTPKAGVPRGSKAYAGPIPKTKQRVFECPGNCETCAACWNLRPNEHMHFLLH